MTGDKRYFVRAAPDAPEKGPFTLQALKQSHARGMLRSKALVREDGSAITETLGELLHGLAVEHAKANAGGKLEAAEAAAIARQRSGNGLLVGGIVTAGVGLAATLGTYTLASEAGGGRYVVFTGLIAAGIGMTIRGIAAR